MSKSNPLNTSGRINVQGEAEQLFDVVIYEIASGKIETFAGKDLPSELGRHGFHTVEKRQKTVEPRLNDHYDVMVVPAGKYQKGDALC